VANDEKFGRLKQLVDSGKEKGYVLYDEVNDLLPDDIATGPELDDLLADFDTAGVEILEEPKLEFDKKLGGEDGDEFAELDLIQDFGDKTNDPVRMYLREMGSVPLLTREGEIELAKRIERGQRSVNKSLSRSPLIVREVVALADEIRRGALHATDVLLTSNEPAINEEESGPDPETVQLLASLDEIDKLHQQAQSCRNRLGATPRQTKGRQHRSLRFELARTMIVISRKIRSISFRLPRGGT
jgi:RNA polymerase primary sigma factor